MKKLLILTVLTLTLGGMAMASTVSAPAGKHGMHKKHHHHRHHHHGGRKPA